MRFCQHWAGFAVVIGVFVGSCASDGARKTNADGVAGTSVQTPAQGSGGAGGGGAGAAAAGSGGKAGSAGQSAATGGSGGSSMTPGGSGGQAAPAGSGGATGAPAGACMASMTRVQITEVDVGTTAVHNEEEATLEPLVISPIASGGARLAFMGSDSMLHVVTLDKDDHMTGAPVTLMAHDFSDLYADENGGVVMLTRDGHGTGTTHCGNVDNLCGTNKPTDACFDMYLVRFDGTAETWATQLTESSDALPPYSTGPMGDQVIFIWWYAHHGRIAFDGANYASYFGSALSVSQSGCINIHQGDRMKIVSSDGKLAPGGFDWGCSHSGYERIVWDPAAKKFVTVCKTDNNNRIAFAPMITTIYPVDLFYSNLGNLVLAAGGGYWLTTSNVRSGQPAMADGLADVRLLHFTAGMADQDISLASDAGLNDRAPHLAQYGSDRMLAAWETSSRPGDLMPNDTGRKLRLQVLDRKTGATEGDAIDVAVQGNRYQDLVAFPDGSVAFAAPGSSATKVKILRVLPCTP